MEYLMKDNGKMVKEKVLVSRFGLMDQNMLVNGRITKPMVRELSITPMVIFMKVNGSMIRLVAKEPIHIKTELNMSDNGKTINKMVMEFNNGSMDKFTKDNIRMEQKLEKES